MVKATGAVNVRTGNFIYFDSKTHRVGAAHVMASSSLPPTARNVHF